MAKILLVEDHPTFARLFHHYLNSDGHTIVHAANGKLGLQLFRQELPDLVITDIAMPVMSGTQFIQQLRFEFVNTRIIALYFGEEERSTAVSTISDLAIASKEVHRPQFMDLVNHELTQRKGELAPREEEPLGNTQASNLSSEERMLDIEVNVTDTGSIEIIQGSHNHSGTGTGTTITMSAEQADLVMNGISKARQKMLTGTE